MEVDEAVDLDKVWLARIYFPEGLRNVEDRAQVATMLGEIALEIDKGEHVDSLHIWIERGPR